MDNLDREIVGIKIEDIPSAIIDYIKKADIPSALFQLSRRNPEKAAILSYEYELMRSQERRGNLVTIGQKVDFAERILKAAK